MTDRLRHKLALAAALVLTAVTSLSGLTWGLPSRAADPFLFGSQPPWDGKTILALAGGWEDVAALPADAAGRPLAGRDQIQPLNDTDARRAQIVRRYRLYSYQPDEMATFRALAGMQPRAMQFDPRMYQYGGLWMYPLGAMLKAAGLVGYLHLTPDLAYYLDHPEAFGRFYVVARLYVVLWALGGAAAVFTIVRRMTGTGAAGGGWAAPLSAAACFALMPVVINMAHEAKPHLPGAVLTLLAVLAAARFVADGRPRWGILTGALCGAAAGMVLTGVVAFAVVPVMAFLHPGPWRARRDAIVGPLVIGLLVFAIANPYVVVHLLRRDPLLGRNVENTAGMYRAAGGLAGVGNTLRLVGEGTSLGLALAGVAALMARLARPETESPKLAASTRALGPLLLAPALLMLLAMCVFGAGKPGEFGRFGLLPDAGLAIAAVETTASRVRLRVARGLILGSLPLLAAGPAMRYVGGFVRDAGLETSRLALARDVQRRVAGGWPITIATHAEPAPYCLPPVNLFGDRLLLLPRGYEPVGGEADVIVDAVDALPAAAGARAGGYVDLAAPGASPTPISWASKPFRVREADPHAALRGGRNP